MTTPEIKRRSVIASSLAGIVTRAAATLPAETGAAARAAHRRDRADVRCVVADVSTSMDEWAGQRRKIDILREALKNIPPAIRIIAFSSIAQDVTGHPLPPPSGSTALHLALDQAAALDPGHVLVISDGHPDDPAAALRAADQMPGVQIDVIYCGPDHDHRGMAFMRRLARGGGQVHRRSMVREPARITQTVRATLALPAR